MTQSEELRSIILYALLLNGLWEYLHFCWLKRFLFNSTMNACNMDGMTRSEVADRAGVGRETVRYYEERGLIPDPPRSAAGYRLYDGNYVERIRFIGRAQELGFTLEEIKELLELRGGPEATCADVKMQAEAKIEDVEAKIRDLKRIRKALVTLADTCAGGTAPTSECPILDAMENENALGEAFS